MAVLPHVLSRGGDPPDPPVRFAPVGVLAVVSRGRRGRTPLAGRVISELRSSGERPRCVRVALGSVKLWVWLLGYAFYITTSSRQYSSRQAQMVIVCGYPIRRRVTARDQRVMDALG